MNTSVKVAIFPHTAKRPETIQEGVNATNDSYY